MISAVFSWPLQKAQASLDILFLGLGHCWCRTWTSVNLCRQKYCPHVPLVYFHSPVFLYILYIFHFYSFYIFFDPQQSIFFFLTIYHKVSWVNVMKHWFYNYIFSVHLPWGCWYMYISYLYFFQPLLFPTCFLPSIFCSLSHLQKNLSTYFLVSIFYFYSYKSCEIKSELFHLILWSQIIQIYFSLW